MKVYLASKVIADYSEFRELPIDNVAKNVSLDGTLTVDVVNFRRQWTFTRELLTSADYQTIRTIYEAQFKNSGAFTNLQVPDLGLNTSVYITLNERNMKWNNSIVSGFQMILEEQNAIS